MRDRKNLLILGLVLATALLFWKATGFEFLNWDDSSYLTDHPWYFPLQLSSIWQMWNPLSLWKGIAVDWSPVRDMTYAIDWFLWGMSSEGFHRTQVLIHAANAGLLALFLSRFMKLPYALLAAAWWAWHPLVVEPVSWISARKDVVLVFFYFSALLAFSRERIWMGVVLGVAAMLSKYPGATIGLLVLLLAGTQIRKRVFASAILLVVGGGLTLFSVLANRHIHKVVTIDEAGWWFENWPAGFQVIHHAMEKALFPLGLSARYVQEANLGWASLKVFSGIALALLVVTWIVRWRNRKPKLAAPLIFGAVTFLPYLPMVPIHIWMADRYLYLSLAGLAWLLACGAQTWDERRGSFWGFGLLGVWSLALAFGSYNRLPVWRDSLSLWADTIQESPQLYYVWGNYASALTDRGEFTKAGQAYGIALKEDPTWTLGHLKLSLTLARSGNLTRAREELVGFERLAGDSMMREETRTRAIVWAELGEEKTAEALFREYLERRPNDPQALGNFGVLLARTGRIIEAESSWNRAIALDPYQRAARLNRARFRFSRGECARMEEDLKALETMHVGVEVILPLREGCESVR